MKKTEFLRRLACSLMLSFLFTAAFAQSRTISGTIVDQTGEPMMGVNVMEKGTTNGGISDMDGNYSLAVSSEKAILVASYIGFLKQEVTVGKQQIIRIVLKEDLQNLDEVVVVGYGVKKKTDLTGAVASVDTEQLVAKGTTSVMEALQGAVPGVNISQTSTKSSSGFSISVRGQNSLSGGSPLYVVDGIVVDDINFLNPSDIERIDILKDASSNAIYGSRGSNGVIQVTTRQAAKKDKVSVSYDGYFGIKQTARLPDFYDGDEFFDYRLRAYTTPASTNATTREKTWEITPQNIQTALLSPTIVNRWVNKDYEDWVGLGFNNGSQQNHFVNINGTSGQTNYIVSLGYQGERGSFSNDKMDRLNFRGGINTRLFNIATIGIQTNLSYSVSDDGAANSVQNMLRMNPFEKAYDADGNLIALPGGSAAVGSSATGGGQYTSQYNPLLDIQNTTDNTRRFYLLNTVYAEIEPIKGLKFKTQFAPNIRSSRRGQFWDVMTGDRVTAGTNRAIVQNRNYMEYTWDNSAFYQGSTGDHSYDATAVWSVYQTRYETNTSEVEDLAVPGFYNLGSASNILAPSGDFQMTSLLSAIARLNYSYKGRYLATATARMDGSSKLANKWALFPSVALGWRITEEAFMEKADWLSNLKLRASFGYSGNNNGISPYGTQTLASSKYYYGFGTSSAIGFGPNGIANTNISWEKTRELNLGLDFGFLDGRISGTFDWYDKLSEGLIMKRILPVETGVLNASVYDNIGSVSNRGIELGISTINVRTKKVQWTTSLSFSKNTNAIQELFGGKEDVLASRWFIGQPIQVAYTYIYDGVVKPADAKDPNSIAYKNNLYEGMAKIKDISGPNGEPDGKLSSLDRTITGSMFPDWTGSFSSNLKVHNVDFSFNLYANWGRYVRSPFMSEAFNINERARGRVAQVDMYVPENVNIRMNELTGGNEWWYKTELDKAGKTLALTPNPNGQHPMYGSAQYGPWWNVASDDFQNGWTDASFVKVKNISLGYTFPSSMTKKWKVENLRLYCNVLNPFVFTKKGFVGYDPEWADASLTGGNSTTGVSGTTGGPASIVYQFGINLKF